MRSLLLVLLLSLALPGVANAKRRSKGADAPFRWRNVDGNLEWAVHRLSNVSPCYPYVKIKGGRPIRYLEFHLVGADRGGRYREEKISTTQLSPGKNILLSRVSIDAADCEALSIRIDQLRY